MEELAEGFTSALDRCNAQERLARNTIQCQSESSNKDIVEALGHGSIYTTYRATRQVRQANTPIQRWSECAPELTPDLREACRMRALWVGTLDNVMAPVVPAFLGGYTRRISIFMSIHPAFSSAHRFLDQLLTR
ncbi:ral guanine nucleotide dissociation stimulator-like [Desmodus rotundus]|uniref:ral guanine nucleotide dissociation stimulator-like n=1 Tax=Desmodus rotundus TaxID=9430 RepID=UPI0023811AE5|nr:ral guanine nucleotide dissociation stimulator-like [Desmodus rotundus]